MANDFTGRVLRITATGTIPLANFKVEGGDWTGGSGSFVLVDAAGRTYTWTWDTTSGVPIVITKLGWLSGPVTISTFGGGEAHLYLGTK